MSSSIESDAVALAEQFATGEADPKEVLQACLQQIDLHDSALGIFNARVPSAELETLADAAADRWRADEPRSPLDGIPFAVKANIAVNGLPWHAGVAALRDRIADVDAAVVERLRDAGMIPVGILNMHEAALGATSQNPAFLETHNPHAFTHIPGGSSGGSAAAVAAGMLPIALGTDDMGSVRLPSALCGVVGFKPSRGILPVEGVVPLSPRLDHVGIHARSVRDVRAVLELFDGAVGDTTTEEVTVARWHLPAALKIEPDVQIAVDDVLNQLNQTTVVDWSGVDFSVLRRAGLLICERDAYGVYADLLDTRPDDFSREFRALLDWAAKQPKEKVERAESMVRSAGVRLRADLDGKVLVSATTPSVAPFRGADVPTDLADLTAPAALAGVPAISVPVGMSRGLPIGLHIAGEDANQVLRAAERVLPTSAPVATACRDPKGAATPP